VHRGKDMWRSKFTSSYQTSHEVKVINLKDFLSKELKNI
jgi:hypothetical protein